jgi:hypothetical protein
MLSNAGTLHKAKMPMLMGTGNISRTLSLEEDV